MEASALYRTRRGKHELADVEPGCQHQEIQDSPDIDFHVDLRLLKRRAHSSAGCEVDNHFRPLHFENRFQSGPVTNVDLMKG